MGNYETELQETPNFTANDHKRKKNIYYLHSSKTYMEKDPYQKN